MRGNSAKWEKQTNVKNKQFFEMLSLAEKKEKKVYGHVESSDEVLSIFHFTGLGADTY